jgi:hypothetical protein
MQAPNGLSPETDAELAGPESDHPLQRRMDAYLLRWDRHVGGCGDCLATGTGLCAEARYLALEVEKARNRLARLQTRALRPAAKGRTLPAGIAPDGSRDTATLPGLLDRVQQVYRAIRHGPTR